MTRSWPVLLGVLFVAASIPAFAQEATIVGTVTDPTGSLVPNVTITLTNTDTSVIRTIQTNDAGEYVAPDMHIGHYTAKAEGQGFSTAEKTGLVLSVGDRLRVDFAMKMGAATERVTVEAATVAVQTDTGEVSDLISGQQITKLESNGRNIYSLVNLTPGASSEQSDFIAPVPVGGDADVSFNGQRPGHNIYLMDGGEDLDRGGAGNFSVMPSLESLAEFRVLSSNYSAEYGLSSSATMTTVVKSGSNQFHGSGWWFGRNDALDSRNYFNPAPQKVAELRFNTYGFNIGGPVDFKKSDHKTFFFYNMEWRSLIQGQTLNTNVPLPSTYGGNFGSTLINVPGLTQEQPSTLFAHCPGGVAPAGVVQGQPFPNNTIPACMLDPNAQALLGAKIFPAPTSGNQFLGGNNAPTTVREEIVRADHRFNDKFSVFGHWVSEQISQTYGTSQWSGDNVPTIGDTFGNPSYSAVVHATHTIRPNLLNEIAFNYNGNRINIIPKAGFGAPLSAPSGFTFNRIFSGPNPLNRIPSINLSLTNTNYTVNWMPWVNKADDYQIRDDVSWVKGAHQLKIGGSWALYKKIQDVFANTEGNFTFNGFFTKNDFADFLLGDASGYSEDAVHDNGHWNSVSWAAYVQDNWRVNNRLTLNLGLRWDGAPHTYEALHRSSNFYP
ncbi:MAG: carboxypeptidase regulatory-like domain-containing protein, partial [Acidobacteria bacterium]|nr:carboxypeptidase regulatory-like domain-containing protein [Acidobacteriota bacterium]